MALEGFRKTVLEIDATGGLERGSQRLLFDESLLDIGLPLLKHVIIPSKRSKALVTLYFHGF